MNNTSRLRFTLGPFRSCLVTWPNVYRKYRLHSKRSRTVNRRKDSAWVSCRLRHPTARAALRRKGPPKADYWRGSCLSCVLLYKYEGFKAVYNTRSGQADCFSSSHCIIFGVNLIQSTPSHIFFLLVALQPNSGHGHLILDVLRSQPKTPHSR